MIFANSSPVVQTLQLATEGQLNLQGLTHARPSQSVAEPGVRRPYQSWLHAQFSAVCVQCVHACCLPVFSNGGV